MLRKHLLALAAAALAITCLFGCSSQGGSPSSSSSSAPSSASSSVSSEAAEDAKAATMYVLEPAALFAEADEAAERVADLAIAEVVERVAEEGGWVQVKADGKEGYVLAAALTEDENAAAAAKVAAEQAQAAAQAEAAAAEAAAAEQAQAAEQARVAEAAAAAEAQAKAEAAAAAQAQAEAEAKAAKEAKEAKEAKGKAAVKELSREYFPPCDGHADGYTVITYSDGSEKIVEGKA